MRNGPAEFGGVDAIVTARILFGTFLMDLNEYQRAGQETNLLAAREQSERLIAAMLGLASEVGSLLDVHKKVITEQIDSDTGEDIFRQELGDLLWYVAAVAAAKGYELEELATSNLDRTRGLWEEYRSAPDFTGLPQFDESYPAEERFPRQITIEFQQFEEGGHTRAHMKLGTATPNAFADGPIVDHRGLNGKTQGFTLGAQIGDYLTDNSRRVDGYRFHDAIHLGFLAVLGWSPTIRSVLRLKRRSEPETDEAEDGARAIFSEEALAAALSRLARRRMDYQGDFNVDGETIDIVRACTEGLEVQEIPGWAWRRAIVEGFEAKRQLTNHDGGTLVVDLDERHLRFTTPA